MKTRLKLLPVLTLLLTLSCNAQQTYPLDANPFSIPANSYMKDSNNYLNHYVGTWKANYDNKVYILYVTKELNRYVNSIKMYQDVLKVKYEVRTQDELLTINANINSSSITTSDKHGIFSFSLKSNGNKVQLYYGGTNCGIGWGVIEFTKLNATQFNWKYSPNSSTINDDVCPPGQDLKIYLPITSNLVFTKQ